MSLIYKGKTIADVGGGGAAEVYSTEETRIGTWIDGKPLYRKVASISLENNARDQQFNIGLADVDVVTNHVVRVKRSVAGNGWISDGYANSGVTLMSGVRTDNFNLWVSVVSFSDVSGQPAFAIVEYTKTTDEASGS